MTESNSNKEYQVYKQPRVKALYMFADEMARIAEQLQFVSATELRIANEYERSYSRLQGLRATIYSIKKQLEYLEDKIY